MSEKIEERIAIMERLVEISKLLNKFNKENLENQDEDDEDEADEFNNSKEWKEFQEFLSWCWGKQVETSASFISLRKKWEKNKPDFPIAHEIWDNPSGSSRMALIFFMSKYYFSQKNK